MFHFHASLSWSINQFKKKKKRTFHRHCVCVTDVCTACVPMYAMSVWSSQQPEEFHRGIVGNGDGPSAYVFTVSTVRKGSTDLNWTLFNPRHRRQIKQLQFTAPPRSRWRLFCFFLSWILMNFWREQKQNRAGTFDLPVIFKEVHILSVKYVCQ